jgi:hypothetical protein
MIKTFGIQTRFYTLNSISQTVVILAKFQILKAASTKIAVFWDVAPCSLVDYLVEDESLIALMMEAVRTSETLVNFYQTTQRYNPEDSHLRACIIFRRWENLGPSHLRWSFQGRVESQKWGPPVIENEVNGNVQVFFGKRNERNVFKD